MDRTRTGILTSPLFITVLGVLVLNDFVLKPHFHNSGTGKLSDFAGLFIFPLFFSMWVPRLRTGIYISTALAFMFWKSPYSQSLIETMNAVSPFDIGRTVDLTDLIAMFVLPVSWLCAPVTTSSTLKMKTLRTAWAVVVSAVCLFAFAATSTVEPSQTITYDKDYPFEFSRNELSRRMSNLYLKSFYVDHRPESDIYGAKLDEAICSPAGFESEIGMVADAQGEGKSTLRLATISYRCGARLPGDRQKLLSEFEKRVIEGLRSNRPTAARIRGILYDDKLKPAALTDVRLISLKDGRTQTRRVYVADVDGSFDFAPVLPGTYVLEVGDAHTVNSAAPYDHRFYPGVPSLERAEKLVVNGPLDLNNLQFRLGPRHATRLIRVSAVWKDGRPVTNGLVWCYGGSDWQAAYTDLHGKATCEVIADREYTVTVGRLTWTESDVPT